MTNPPEDDPEMYAAARDQIMNLIKTGKAIELLDAYSEHNQSCYYVWTILVDVANDNGTGISQDVKNFAANLLDDWMK